jgi:hypothetical protein
VYNEAVSDRVEDVEFKITNNNASSSILELKDHLFEHPDIDVVRRINVATTTLDSIVNKHKIQANFLSMDIQGAELKCLQGFEENLKMIDTIYTEVNTRELYAGCVRLEELDAWLGARGFVRREICMTYHGWGDALYVRQ